MGKNSGERENEEHECERRTIQVDSRPWNVDVKVVEREENGKVVEREEILEENAFSLVEKVRRELGFV